MAARKKQAEAVEQSEDMVGYIARLIKVLRSGGVSKFQLENGNIALQFAGDDDGEESTDAIGFQTEQQDEDEEDEDNDE